MKIKSNYINTDLDIVSDKDLENLIPILEEKCNLLHAQRNQDGFWHLTIEAKGSGIVGHETHNPTRDLHELLAIIERLSKKTKKLLSRAKIFDFNIGLQSSKEYPEGTFKLANKLLNTISKLGATLTVTIYPTDENDL